MLGLYQTFHQRIPWLEFQMFPITSVFDVSDNVFTISEPPVITVLPDSFNVVLNEGDSTDSIINSQIRVWEICIMKSQSKM